MGELSVNKISNHTIDPAPRLEQYRQSLKVPISRPALEDLHEPSQSTSVHVPVAEVEEENINADTIKFGWIRGVFVRGILSLLGATIFMRMGWMAGQAGLLGSLEMVALGTLITVLTTMSMSVLCTNGQVKGGGPYYLVSRSLGVKFGVAVGVLLTLANCAAVSMYVVAAAETVRDILINHGLSIFGSPSGINDVRLIAAGFLMLVILITSVGMDFEAKAQLVLLGCIVSAFVSFFVGSFSTPSDVLKAKGFLGYSLKLGYENLLSAYTPGQSFFTVFAVFFPSVIGILSGASISGDLKDPSSAIPRGTFWSIGVTSLSYALIPLMLGLSVVRYASGNVADLADGSFISKCTPTTCPYGLMQYYQVMEMISAIGPLIYVGNFAATISSALASQVAAPRLLQALAKDDVLPGLSFFAKGRGSSDNPVRASVLCLIVAFVFMLIGDLNAISVYISLFFIFTFGAINFAAFHASHVGSPGFRPDFKWKNKWLSLIGSIVCFGVMFVMDWVTALVTTLFSVAIILFVMYKKPAVNWGSSTEGAVYMTALNDLHNLEYVEENVKNYRPSVLLLSGNPGSRPALVDLASQITDRTGILICGHVLFEAPSYKSRNQLQETNKNWLKERKVKAFYSQMDSKSLASGAYALAQSGIGKMRPNILLLGFKNDYKIASLSASQEYVECIHRALDLHMSLAILRVPKTVGLSRLFEDVNGFPEESAIKSVNAHFKRNGDTRVDSTIVQVESILPEESSLEILNMFKNVSRSNIDVWWINDDGGLTLLLPHLLSTRKNWKNSKIRFFNAVADSSTLQNEQTSLINLLKSLRIRSDEVKIVPGLADEPKKETVAKFEESISMWRESDPEGASALLDHYQEKTRKCLRISELIAQHSNAASLVVVTCPVPRKNQSSSLLFLAWLDLISSTTAPCMLVRGNQDAVLTSYL